MEHPFSPIRWAGHGYLQTIAGVYWPRVGQVGGTQTRHLVSIGNDGHLAVTANQPGSWRPGNRVILLVHGLTGSEDSGHIIRLANAFERRGFVTLRMNMRGCGPGEGLARGIYHSGRSEDTRSVLEWAGLKYPGSPVTQIGISLGGNATLKMAGEFGTNPPDYLERVIAVSAPIDLAASSKLVSSKRNAIFDRYFATSIIRQVQAIHRKFPDKVPPIPRAVLVGRKSLARIDDLYVAPVSGFSSGQDYYKKCSSAPLIGAIKPRTLLLTASDDPIADVAAYKELRLSSNHEMIITNHGGHVGWISRHKHGEHGRFWMDRTIINWVGKP